ncbi:MAG TPA: DsbA family oxidoreductase [Methanocorpusculum sp.]|nr:DsbA family oxidoreductase [Methanocorpusculum sp.]
MGAGKSVGLDFNYDIMRSCNTKKAQRLCKWAGTYGKLNEMTIAVMDGYFTKGKELNHNEDLLEMVKNVGLDVQEAEKVLNSDKYLEEVDTDIREARMFGIQSVPFFIFENRLAVSGAQPVEVFMQALQKTQTICEEGTTCGPDGCSLG